MPVVNLDRFSRPLWGEESAVINSEMTGNDIEEVVDDIKYEIKLCKDRLEEWTERLENEPEEWKRFWYRGVIEGEKSAYQALKYVLQSAEQTHKKHAG